ncbi:MAG: hypothetical protein WCJ30_16990, partial [Deltaproteobacteria bacterium]
KWNAALVLAGGARPMGGTMLNKFGTRFSGYILDPAMRRLQDPGRILKPVGEPGFFWDKFVYEKDTGTDGAALILQLVNIGPGFAVTGAKSPPIGVGPAGSHHLREEILRCRHEHAAVVVAVVLVHRVREKRGSPCAVFGGEQIVRVGLRDTCAGEGLVDSQWREVVHRGVGGRAEANLDPCVVCGDE